MPHLAALLLALALPAAAPSAGKAPPKIVVTGVKTVQGVSQGTAEILAEMIVTRLGQQRRYQVMSNRDIAALIGFDKQKALLSCDDESCLKELGGALGADYLLEGQVGQLGSRFRIALTLLDTRRAVVLSRQSTFCEQDEDQLADSADRQLDAIIADLEGDLVRRGYSAAPPAAASRGGGWTRRTWSCIAGGAALALLAGGGTSDFLAWRAYQVQKETLDPSVFDAKDRAGRNLALSANVLYGAGALALGTGLYLYFTDRPAPAPFVSVAPTSDGFVAAFTGVLP